MKNKARSEKNGKVTLPSTEPRGFAPELAARVAAAAQTLATIADELAHFHAAGDSDAEEFGLRALEAAEAASEVFYRRVGKGKAQFSPTKVRRAMSLLNDACEIVRDPLHHVYGVSSADEAVRIADSCLQRFPARLHELASRIAAGEDALAKPAADETSTRRDFLGAPVDRWREAIATWDPDAARWDIVVFRLFLGRDPEKLGTNDEAKTMLRDPFHRDERGRRTPREQ